MTTTIALLRGINVGRAKRVAMADLRRLVEDLGYRNVRTLLNSGNVVFDVPRAVRGNPASRIERAMTGTLGVSSRITILTGAELAVIARGNPLLEIATDPSRLLVTVLTNPADLARLTPLTRERWTPDALAIGPRVAYCWCPAGVLESPLSIAVAKALGDGATTRNWSTIVKLHTMAESPA